MSAHRFVRSLGFVFTVVAAAGASGLVASGQTAGIREVAASAHTVIPLQTRIRYTTMILLPDDDEILDVVTGDRDFWVISATHNIAHVKPAKEGAATNLNLVTASGAVYSFLLTEKGNSTPDLKVYVTPDPGTARGKAKYYTAAQFESVQTEATAARDAYARALADAGYSPITTEIAPAPEFFYAEDYHQQYLAKNPEGYCGIGGTGVTCPVGAPVAPPR